MTNLLVLTLPTAALTLSLVGLAGAHQEQAAAVPLACEIAVLKGRHGLTYQGVVEARRPVAGTYELTLEKRGRGGSATISQSGTFDLATGATETLGEATLGGLPAESVEAELTLRVGETTYICGTLPRDI